MMVRADKLKAELKSLVTLSPVQLRHSWLGLSGLNLPHASPSLLRHLIAHQLQEKAVGKLPTYIERELDRLSGNSDAASSTLPRRGPILLGTRFVREWNGKTIAVTREHWASAQPVCKIVCDAFARVGLPYFNPHQFRHMLTTQAYQRCKTIEHFKAWSQNFGHKSMLTTMVSYGRIDRDRQGAIIQMLGNGANQDDAPMTKGDLAELKRLLAKG